MVYKNNCITREGIIMLVLFIILVVIILWCSIGLYGCFKLVVLEHENNKKEENITVESFFHLTEFIWLLGPIVLLGYLCYKYKNIVIYKVKE